MPVNPQPVARTRSSPGVSPPETSSNPKILPGSAIFPAQKHEIDDTWVVKPPRHGYRLELDLAQHERNFELDLAQHERVFEMTGSRKSNYQHELDLAQHQRVFEMNGMRKSALDSTSQGSTLVTNGSRQSTKSINSTDKEPNFYFAEE